MADWLLGFLIIWQVYGVLMVESSEKGNARDEPAVFQGLMKRQCPVLRVRNW